VLEAAAAGGFPALADGVLVLRPLRAGQRTEKILPVVRHRRDTLGLLLTVVVLTTGVQDRDGAKPVLLDTHLRTRVRFVFADGPRLPGHPPATAHIPGRRLIFSSRF
jgi:hypothetical protein